LLTNENDITTGRRVIAGKHASPKDDAIWQLAAMGQDPLQLSDGQARNHHCRIRMIWTRSNFAHFNARSGIGLPPTPTETVEATVDTTPAHEYASASTGTPLLPTQYRRPTNRNAAAFRDTPSPTDTLSRTRQHRRQPAIVSLDATSTSPHLASIANLQRIHPLRA
jgi:hypothetical protein